MGCSGKSTVRWKGNNVMETLVFLSLPLCKAEPLFYSFIYLFVYLINSYFISSYLFIYSLLLLQHVVNGRWPICLSAICWIAYCIKGQIKKLFLMCTWPIPRLTLKFCLVVVFWYQTMGERWRNYYTPWYETGHLFCLFVHLLFVHLWFVHLLFVIFCLFIHSVNQAYHFVLLTVITWVQ